MRRARRRTHLALHKAVVVVVDVTEGQRDENQNQQHGDEGTNRQSSRRRHLVDSLLGSSAVLYELSVSVLASFVVNQMQAGESDLGDGSGLVGGLDHAHDKTTKKENFGPKSPLLELVRTIFDRQKEGRQTPPDHHIINDTIH